MSKLALVPLAALLAGWAPARADETIPWQHPALELYRSGVQDESGRLRRRQSRPSHRPSLVDGSAGLPRPPPRPRQ